MSKKFSNFLYMVLITVLLVNTGTNIIRISYQREYIKQVKSYYNSLDEIRSELEEYIAN